MAHIPIIKAGKFEFSVTGTQEGISYIETLSAWGIIVAMVLEGMRADLDPIQAHTALDVLEVWACAHGLLLGSDDLHILTDEGIVKLREVLLQLRTTAVMVRVWRMTFIPNACHGDAHDILCRGTRNFADACSEELDTLQRSTPVGVQRHLFGEMDRRCSELLCVTLGEIHWPRFDTQYRAAMTNLREADGLLRAKPQ